MARGIQPQEQGMSPDAGRQRQEEMIFQAAQNGTLDQNSAAYRHAKLMGWVGGGNSPNTNTVPEFFAERPVAKEGERRGDAGWNEQADVNAGMNEAGNGARPMPGETSGTSWGGIAEMQNADKVLAANEEAGRGQIDMVSQARQVGENDLRQQNDAQKLKWDGIMSTLRLSMDGQMSPKVRAFMNRSMGYGNDKGIVDSGFKQDGSFSMRLAKKVGGAPGEDLKGWTLTNDGKMAVKDVNLDPQDVLGMMASSKLFSDKDVSDQKARLLNAGYSPNEVNGFESAFAGVPGMYDRAGARKAANIAATTPKAGGTNVTSWFRENLRPGGISAFSSDGKGGVSRTGWDGSQYVTINKGTRADDYQGEWKTLRSGFISRGVDANGQSMGDYGSVMQNSKTGEIKFVPHGGALTKEQQAQESRLELQQLQNEGAVAAAEARSHNWDGKNNTATQQVLGKMYDTTLRQISNATDPKVKEDLQGQLESIRAAMTESGIKFGEGSTGGTSQPGQKTGKSIVEDALAGKNARQQTTRQTQEKTPISEGWVAFYGPDGKKRRAKGYVKNGVAYGSDGKELGKTTNNPSKEVKTPTNEGKDKSSGQKSEQDTATIGGSSKPVHAPGTSTNPATRSQAYEQSIMDGGKKSKSDPIRSRNGRESPNGVLNRNGTPKSELAIANKMDDYDDNGNKRQYLVNTGRFESQQEAKARSDAQAKAIKDVAKKAAEKGIEVSEDVIKWIGNTMWKGLTVPPKDW